MEHLRIFFRHSYRIIYLKIALFVSVADLKMISLLIFNFYIQVRDSRNKLMHSSTMSLSQQELDDHVDAMIALLQDPGPLKTTISSQDAVKEMSKVGVSISRVFHIL